VAAGVRASLAGRGAGTAGPLLGHVVLDAVEQTLDRGLDAIDRSPHPAAATHVATGRQRSGDRHRREEHLGAEQEGEPSRCDHAGGGEATDDLPASPTQSGDVELEAHE